MEPRETGGAVEEAAPAKVNLFLHIRGRRPDGYHLLESLAVFPRLGDRLWAEDGPGLSLSLSGPFADQLPSDGENLVLQAAERLARAHGRPARAALSLEKCLPVASGIGGGSADAAAALRALSRLWGVTVPPDLALGLGADVPVCLDCRAPRLMGGIGERLSPAPNLPSFWLVLVNPGISVSTGAVFGRLAARENPPGPAAPARFATVEDLVAWLRAQRNDLEPAAEALCPPIAAAKAALSGAPLARMSGSGATVFGLYPSGPEALSAADAVRRAYPAWWVAAGPMERAPALA
ncbi:MAG: 4-(cytidine 5'-diphospho)-2-C-methyl-D-erythritol kinase [Paracoccaceae bacterium]